ncbi:hypothetical protein [Barnesiella sp. B2-R-119]|jgi:hypothetical protein|uniref:hypothetical protein n=1 Tax=Barnesiella TaxID=397864 RepID=UPI000E99E2C7|nr:hypothetical protein [Barnesiella sp. B2-R-119]MCM0689183.1 hypothetical protein [Barnesiella sp. B2-R-119]HBO10214.1 hypothetical protein [Barnesiella sp.]HBX18144.1 hypothetical protein [Barnesiella sp.]
MKFIRIFALLPFLGVVSIMNISARSLSSDLKTLAQNSRYKMMLCAHRGNTAAGFENNVPERLSNGR